MRRRDFIKGMIGSTAWPLAARAQSSDQVRRIGVLMQFAKDDPEGISRATALNQGLEQKGWIVGRNVQIDYRWSTNNVEKTRAAATELLAWPADVILANTSEAVVTLQSATKTTPIIFLTIHDPVGQGFVKNLAHPGGNITGFTQIEATVGAKWLELLKEIAPQTKRVMFMSSNNPGPKQLSRSVEAAGAELSIDVIKTEVHGLADIEAAIAQLAQQSNGGMIIPPDGFLIGYRKRIVELAQHYRLPSVYGLSIFMADSGGGLASYGINSVEQFRQAAEYVDRIFRGEKAGNLPVQQPTKYELIINLKAAKALGLTVPSQLLASADHVIE